ncbi:unnamed protein product [Bursaphelenchus xylophilus]|uniref:(pine wood nematode) hypothetical protein n=1 Tax=Bursaphelenchus xylophilus TaxID=6326 RepID=A0A7I8XK13_BURXY|nr:unnamed protein product [Bursaphelenchus xylophilus]CAG9118197.1 unnamed protein product [Bursaphelenchus xylophilus]
MIGKSSVFAARISFSIDCRLPRSPNIKFTDLESATFRSVRVFECFNGLDWYSFPSTCEAGGVWSAFPEACETNKQDPCVVEIIKNGRITNLNRSAGYMEYECGVGYKPPTGLHPTVPTANATCSASKWSPNVECSRRFAFLLPRALSIFIENRGLK